MLHQLQEAALKTAHWSAWKMDGPMSFGSTESMCNLNFTGAGCKTVKAGLQIYILGLFNLDLHRKRLISPWDFLYLES